MLKALDLRRRHWAGPIPRGSRYATSRSCCRMKKPYSSACAAGYTYNGVGALKLLGKLPRHTIGSKSEGQLGAEFVESVTKWLVSRQTLTLHEGEELPMADDDQPDPTPMVFPPRFSNASVETPSHDLQWAGFNGRCNKVADTCYAFWVGGTLGVSDCHALPSVAG